MIKEILKQLSIVLTINVIVGLVLAYFIYPENGKEYSGFWDGLILGSAHGGLFISNYILSFFFDGRLIKAEISSGLYDFSWWSGVILYFVNIVRAFVIFIVAYIKFKDL